jgi:ribosomal protein S18 acetylase RimI-like enzyme
MGKPRYTLTLEDNPVADDLEVVRAGLDAFNRSVIQTDKPAEFQSVYVLVRANDGTVMGGLLGGTWWGWLYISILWVHDDLRGQDFGSDLMRTAEQQGIKRGCHSAFVDTHSFQALPFYQKLGYTVFGELEDFPPGHTRYYLKKRLAVD